MYNGYKNYETWSVKLIIDNTQPLYINFKDITIDIIENIQDESKRTEYLAKIIKQWLEGTCPTTKDPLWQQILTNILEGRIDCYEIAKCLLEDHKEEAA